MQDLTNHEDRVGAVNKMADKLQGQHPDEETIERRRQELNEAWERLKTLTFNRQDRCVINSEVILFTNPLNTETRFSKAEKHSF